MSTVESMPAPARPVKRPRKVRPQMRVTRRERLAAPAGHDERVVALLREVLAQPRPDTYLVNLAVEARRQILRLGHLGQTLAALGHSYAGLLQATAVLRTLARADYAADDVLHNAGDGSDRMEALGNLLAVHPANGGLLDMECGSIAFDPHSEAICRRAEADAAAVLVAARARYAPYLGGGA